MPIRKLTRLLRIGGVPVGGNSPVTVQSMTNTKTADAGSTIQQIRELAEAGCQIVRSAVPDMDAAEALRDITAASPVPVVADIHFDHRLALAAIRAGVHAVRINPGNIGSADRVKQVVEAAGNAGIPIRVGANGGSLPKGLLDRLIASGMSHDDALAEALCIAAMEQVKLLESFDFHAIAVSLKSSSVPVTASAYRRFSERSDYPLHLGVTEAGTRYRGIIKSAAGIGALLLDGIGDTIRVSLTASPVEEIRAAIAILEAVGVRDSRPEIVSCPTCGRTAYDMIALAERVEDFIRQLKQDGTDIPIRKIAVMGCVVNGPGEAKDAEIGVAGGGNGKLMLFRHGEVAETIPEAEGFERLKQEIITIINGRNGNRDQ